MSFLRAVGGAGFPVDIVFLNSAPIPGERHRMMREHGEVIDIEGLDLLRSYWRATRIPIERAWPLDDLVYFAEDDYLYRSDALARLAEAAAAMPNASYFSLYATVGTTMPNGMLLEGEFLFPPPADWAGIEWSGPHGVGWHCASSTTSSFAVRVRALHRDQWIHKVAPRCGYSWDHAAMMVAQGFQPYPFRIALTMLRDRRHSTQRRLKLAAWHTLVNVGWLRNRRRRHVLVASSPSLATHCETEFLALGHDWASEAALTETWGRQRGLR